MATEEEIQRQLELLEIRRRNLAFLLKQKAQYGDIDVPIKIVNEISNSRLEIQRIKMILFGWNRAIDGHPDDIDPWNWSEFGIYTNEPFDWELAKQNYLNNIKDLHGTIRILGMTAPTSLDGIFTDIHILDKPSAWQRYTIDELQKQFNTLSTSTTHLSNRLDGLDVVRRVQRLFVLGKPGAGKTTFLKYLTLQAIEGRIDLIPILITTRDWADSELDLLDFLTHQFKIHSFPQARQFIEFILREGKSIVLFDGLDEISQDQQDRFDIIRSIREFSERYTKIQCVITCRTAAMEYEFEKFTYCELADFTEQQIRFFVSKWFQLDASNRDAFLKEFARPQHERLRELARTPLLLTLLCINFEETLSFPDRRVEIYEEALDVLLRRWDSSRKIQRVAIYKQLSTRQKHQMLSYIAVETFKRNEIFMRKVDLEERIQNYISKLPTYITAETIDAEPILKAIEAHHGLLVERAARIYSFSHLTFHEYFTARYIIEHPSEEIINETMIHATDPRWHEILLLTASMLDAHNTKIFFECFIQTLDRVISSSQSIHAILVWTTQTAAAAGAADFATRLFYLRTALTIKLIPEIARTRALAAVLARALARANDQATTLARNIADSRSSTRVLANDLVNVLERAGNRANTIASELNRASGRANISELALTNARASTSATALATDVAYASELANDLGNLPGRAGELERASELARDLARSTDGIRDLARRSAHTSTLARARDQARTTAATHRDKISAITFFSNDLRILVALAQTHELSQEKLFANEIRGIWQKVTTNPIMHYPEQKELKLSLQLLSLPPNNASKQTWRIFSEQLERLLVEQGYSGPTEQLDEAQYILLDKYFQILALLLECLDAATVGEREGIRNRLLHPAL